MTKTENLPNYITPNGSSHGNDLSPERHGAYDDMLWQGVAREVVTRGCWLKFGQNEEIWKEMDRTGETLFVECAPRDMR